MKITFVLANWVSLAGGVRSNAMLAYHLQKRGHQVFVVSPSKSQPTLKQQVFSLFKGKGLINIKQQGTSHFDNLDIPRQVLEHGPPVTDADVPDADIVVASWWETAEWVANLSPSKGAKVYLIRHHEVHDYLPIEKVKKTYYLPLHKITISQWLVNIMKNEYGDNNVSLVPNSIDFNKYFAPPRSKQANPTVGMLYKITKWKGCDLTLKAFELAKQAIPDLHLVAFGLEEPSSTLPLPPGTKYYQNPPQEKIKDIYAQCDAWLFGSRVEGFGRPILEAMACHTPVIGTPAGAAPELIAKGGGRLVKLEDAEDMARAIIEITKLSNKQWQAISDIAYNTAISYTWDDAAELCEQAFYQAIERTKHGDLIF
ncbi:MAG TPA: glycosyl transferase family 1 [Cyanothece sp. UBA12306]|nr:glycosyl transferase family 1 [Cyanothece sp. UBA12306]